MTQEKLPHRKELCLQSEELCHHNSFSSQQTFYNKRSDRAIRKVALSRSPSLCVQAPNRRFCHSMAELLLQAFNKTVESLLSFLGSLVDTGIFQYLHEYQTDLLLDNTVDILCSDSIVFRSEFIYPVCMLCQFFIGS